MCTVDPCAALAHCDRVIYCGTDKFGDERIETYETFGKGTASDKIYIPTLCDEDALADACDYISESNATAIVRASYDLNEAGIIEAKYKLSPIMLLHKLGVLGRCAIAGGVCLDNDDLDLMAQESVPLILLPTASAGYGYGFAPVVAAVARGVKVGIGTFDGKYNPSADIEIEAAFMRLVANAEMRAENSLSDADIAKIMEFA